MDTEILGYDGLKHIKTIIQAQEKRRELGIEPDDFVIISVGELNANKNHEVIIKAIAKLKNPHIKYILCGQGVLKEYLMQRIIEHQLEKQVKLLGYRTDIAELLKMSDLFAFPSKREGLGLAAIEAMAAGLPLLTSDIHGINDYSIQEVTGYKDKINDYIGYAGDIGKCISDKYMIYMMGKNNQSISMVYDKGSAEKVMKKIYYLLIRKCGQILCDE